MSNDNRQIKFRLFDGPSLVAPFAAVIAEFANPFQATLSATEIRQIWSKLNSAASPLNLARTDEGLDYAGLAAEFAKAWQDQFWHFSPPVLVTRVNEERFQIACGFFDHGATKAVLEAGINIANAIFLRATGTAEAAQAQAAVQGIVSGIPARPLSITTASLTRLAGKRGIPFYSVCRNVLCLFGQGVNGFYFTNMANQEDSITGWRISENKALTSDVLRQLGFPTTEHGIATDITTAIQIGNTLGFLSW